MIRVCQNLLAAGTLVLVFSGCSIVVFEDGEDCKVTKKCLVVDLPRIQEPDYVPELAVEPEQPEQLSDDQPPKKHDEDIQPDSEPPIVPPEIDGYFTNFEYDSAEIGLQSIDDLKAIAAFLNDKPDVMLTIEGHCDERGSRDYNLALGDRRAVAVRDVLIANGVNKNRVKTVSYGKERPIAFGSTPEIWARNRRAVIRQQPR